MTDRLTSVVTCCCLMAAVLAPCISGAEEVDWQAKFEKKVEALRAEGQPITFAEVLASCEAIPDEENSALILLKAFRALEEADEKHDSPDLDALLLSGELGMRQPEPVLSIIQDYLEKRADVLALIHQAAQLSRGRYPSEVKHDPYARDPRHEMAQVHTIDHCLTELYYRAELGRGLEAAQSLVACRRMATSLGEMPTLVDVLRRIALEAKFCEGLQYCLALCELPAEQLVELREEIRREGEELSLQKALLGKRAAAHYMILDATAEEWHRLYDDLPDGIDDRDPDARARDALYFYKTMDEALEALRLPPRERLRRMKRLSYRHEEELRRRPQELVMSAYLMPSFGRLAVEECAARAGLLVARTGLAVEQWRMAHGQWPKSLEQLVPDFFDEVPQDAFSYRALRYAKTEDGVVIYSLGRDEQDDGGTSRDEAIAHWWPGTESRWDVCFRLLELESRRRGRRASDALHRAAGVGQDELVRMLLQKGVDANVRNDDGQTALHIAAGRGNNTIIKRLLESGAEIDALDTEGRSALHLAARAGKDGAVRILLDANAAVDRADADGRTPLFDAAERGRKAVVKRLLAAGAEVNAIDNKGRTPLRVALQWGQEEVAQLLRQHGGIE